MSGDSRLCAVRKRKAAVAVPSSRTLRQKVNESNPRKGGVLRFRSETHAHIPGWAKCLRKRIGIRNAHQTLRICRSGIQQYHILRKDGLLGRLNLLLPDPALPIRLHECRTEFRGHEGSFENNLTGLAVRLDDDRGDNLEDDFPASCPIAVGGQSMIARIYAFKKDKADTYRKNEGIIFVVNGQTHGYITKDFFNRKSVGRLNYLADSILVMMDCTNIAARAREDLFKNSRDRLSKHEIRFAVEEKLEEMLKQHQGFIRPERKKTQRRNSIAPAGREAPGRHSHRSPDNNLRHCRLSS